MEKISMNTENSKIDEPHKFVPNLSQRLELRSSNKHVASELAHLLHMEKYKTTVQKKSKIIGPTWNDEFELPSSYSVSDIQNCIDYIIKKRNIIHQSSYSYLQQ